MILAFLASRLGRYVAGAAAILALAGGIYAYGAHNARQKADLEAARRTIETDRRIDNADIGSGDFDADLRWLQNRGGR